MSELKSALIGQSTGERCSAGQPRAAVPTWLLATTTLLLAALREIFDESAYTRFLARHGMTSCRSAYAAFLREQEMMKARRPKCC
jgi:hypothetical protein